MKSYTTLRNLYGTLTKNVATANLTFGDQLINDEIRHLCALQDFYFLHRTRTLLTASSTQFYALPYDVDLVESIYVTVGSTRYTPTPVHNRKEWDELNESTYTSDFPEKFIVFDGRLGLWPTPSTASNVITINAKIKVIDLNVADYTTGNISAIANGATAVTGSGTSWTERMGGRWIRMTYSDTANTGDGQWYEISSVSSTTALALVRAYGGTSISAGSASYTIGQMPILPEEYHDTPVFKAAATYWYKEGDATRADKLMEKYKIDLAALTSQRPGPVTDLVLDDGESDEGIINPNLTVHL